MLRFRVLKKMSTVRFKQWCYLSMKNKYVPWPLWSTTIYFWTTSTSNEWRALKIGYHGELRVERRRSDGVGVPFYPDRTCTVSIQLLMRCHLIQAVLKIENEIPSISQNCSELEILKKTFNWTYFPKSFQKLLVKNLRRILRTVDPWLSWDSSSLAIPVRH